MSPTGSEANKFNIDFSAELVNWNRKYKSGKTFDSSEKKKIAPIVPDFIMELRLPSDNLQPIKDKIAEFMECGCQLAWLIDPVLQQTTIYKADSNEEIVSFDKMLTGGDVLPEFEVKLSELLE